MNADHRQAAEPSERVELCSESAAPGSESGDAAAGPVIAAGVDVVEGLVARPRLDFEHASSSPAICRFSPGFSLNLRESFTNIGPVSAVSTLRNSTYFCNTALQVL